MSKEMLINTIEGQECRIAIISDGNLDELYVERHSNASHVGNVYKGRVTNVEPAIQAAFVDFGLGKNGFLHISDLHPKYFPKGQRDDESMGQKRSHRDRPPIQNCIKRGAEVVVQVTKEGIGTKGPTLTTYLSLPGRMLVLMPGMSRLGVSRKIEDEKLRAKAKEILSELTIPDDMGVIVRTAGIDQNKTQLQRDLNYLKRLWASTKKLIDNAKTPAEIYTESDLVSRTIRDTFDSQIKRIICDSPDDAVRVKDFLNVAVPRSRCKVEVYTGKEGLFHETGLEDQIEKIHRRQVPLPSGGSLVIDQTEALVAIDVNSGRYRSNNNAESTALKMNTEAAKEIARQLRLRDLGGVIIIDFIDMYDLEHRRTVERVLKEAMKPDRAKVKVQRISMFGIVEMTRQRLRPSLFASMHSRCPYCNGAGLIKSEESQALEIMRSIRRLASKEEVNRVEVTVTPKVAERLTNQHRAELNMIETNSGKWIIIRTEMGLTGNDVRFACINQQGNNVQCPTGTSSAKLSDIETISISKALADGMLDKTEKAALPAQPQPSLSAGENGPGREESAGPDEDKPAKKRRRGRRGGRRRRRKSQDNGQVEQAKTETQGEAPQPPADKQADQAEKISAPVEKKPDKPLEKASSAEESAPAETSETSSEQPKAKKAKRSRSRGRGRRKSTSTNLETKPAEPKPTEPRGENAESASKPLKKDSQTKEATPAETSENNSDQPKAKKASRSRSRSRGRRKSTSTEPEAISAESKPAEKKSEKTTEPADKPVEKQAKRAPRQQPKRTAKKPKAAKKTDEESD